jgi:hypothetical protein
LLDEVTSLRARINELERERDGRDGRHGAAEADPARRRVGAQP